MKTWLVVSVLALALSGCAGPATDPRVGSTDRVREYFSPPEPYPGPTWTRRGRQVGGRELNSFAGPKHCGWESAVIMHLGWPLGTRSKTIKDARQFIRDPRGVLGKKLRKGLRQNVDPPHDAEDTGYRLDDLELWLAPSDPNGIYLRADKNVERWPRAIPFRGCA